MVAAGPHQPMEDLMTFSLTASTLNPQRIYVLTQRVYNNPKGTLGLYTSTDQGQSWRLALTTSELGDMYFAAAGNESPDEVYVYLTHRGPDALKVSKDGGQHFSTVGTLPLGNLQGLYALPGAPGQLLIYGNDGIARSSDGGQHWETVAGVSGAVFSVASAGPGQPIYASGDAGITRSTDGGKTFNQVYSQSSYNSLSVPATQPQTIYGKLGSGVYRSTDGGQSWQPLPQLKKSLESVVADPGNADQVYLAANYPTEVYHYNAQSSAWTSLTPKP
ncbi:hypothetical protein KTT_12340 [Tengunoibacter tsumagoiensis]|uniref:Sortilin N-terminal domain-containing protein n=2 Tax=Tengunoibacter tsumagoiensis TaxID=2014871 RepID=A0A401ZWX7_9CHLR|nr:hypothetical protein KTT_12340 [Tengunoibacter tsumagoiensis]